MEARVEKAGLKLAKGMSLWGLLASQRWVKENVSRVGEPKNVLQAS